MVEVASEAERPKGQWELLIRITAAINITQLNKKGNYETVNQRLTKIPGNSPVAACLWNAAEVLKHVL